MNKKQKKMLIRIAITAVMLIALAFLPLTGIWRLLAYVAAYPCWNAQKSMVVSLLPASKSTYFMAPHS